MDNIAESEIIFPVVNFQLIFPVTHLLPFLLQSQITQGASHNSGETFIFETMEHLQHTLL